ncbi:TPA: GTP-binding protein [Candidatus Woesearchaeota archaeon]|nr:GTP-binding protein [Candidatus Woesearchaeota archaeon]
MRPQEYVIIKPETGQTYLDNALAAASKRALARRQHRGMDRVMFAKNTEFDRFSSIRDNLVGALEKLHTSFPSFDRMGEFTLQLFEQDIDVGKVKQSLGAINATTTMLKSLTREHAGMVKEAGSVVEIAGIRSRYIGRVSSILRQSNKHLLFLNEARDALRNLPSVDDELFTVAIAGFPNVGKSTLLSKLTTAKPEIKPYAFTTKGLNVGYFDYRYNQIQCIDTPGTLNRKDPNPIERKADIALKYLAHVVVYVFDPTEGGYTLSDQHELYRRTADLGKPVLVFISKTDIVGGGVGSALLKKYPDSYTDIEALRKAINKAFREEFM